MYVLLDKVYDISFQHMGTPPTLYQTECMTGLWKKIQNSNSKGNFLSSHKSGSVNNVKFLIITKMSENIKKFQNYHPLPMPQKKQQNLHRINNLNIKYNEFTKWKLFSSAQIII